MPKIPAICEKCKTMFAASISIGGRNNVFKNCSAGPCPNCGGNGVILDGVYSAIGKALQIFI